MLIDFLKAFFLVDRDQLKHFDNSTVQQSALRILICITLMVLVGVEFDTIWITATKTHDYFLVINSTYIAVLTGLLVFSKKHIKIASALFIATLASIGLLLILFIKDLNADKYALISLYSLPLITRLLFSFRISLLVSFANFASLYLIATAPYSQRVTSEILIPDFTSLYFQILAFVTLNFGLPLAVSRIIFALENNTIHLESLYRRLNRHSALYEEVFEHTGSPTLLCNKHGRVLKANQNAKTLLEVPSKQKIDGTKIHDWLTPQEEQSGQYFWKSNTAECILNRNRDVHIEVHRATLTNHGHYMMHLQDISHLKALKQELESTQETNNRLVYFDPLTRLPNYHYFCNQVNQRIRSEKSHFNGAMFIIRITQFKLLNKRYGKDQANRIILNFAKALQSKISEPTIISRIRGVKFACFTPIGQAYLVQRNLSTLILSLLPNQLRVEGKLLNMEYQIGVAYYQVDGKNAEDLLDHCEMALEYSTNAERISYYNHLQESKLIDNHILGLELSNAIKRNEIVLWLQPQVSANGQVCSFEALARWQKADGNFVSPYIFIHLAENLGLLPVLAENLLRSLIPVLTEWNKEHINIPVAFNLAGQELMNDVFFALLMSLAADYPWLGKMLELEITETSPVMTHPLIHKRLRALHQYGFTIAIDDFGTGQATMGQLIDIPASVLKIDRRFVSPLPSDQRHLDIVKSTIQLAKSLNMKIIAEGIETKEQANLLISLGCDVLQGYYFAKPAPLTDWTDNKHQKAKDLRMVY